MDGVTSTRAELLAKLKREIQDKTYKVKSQEIAEKITQKLREDETSVVMLRSKNRWTT
jgi:anti-sigma28 factor (negative regulator of flagellin synthesis)